MPLDWRRVRAADLLRAARDSTGTPSHIRVALSNVIAGLSCCERDADLDGNCPIHRNQSLDPRY